MKKIFLFASCVALALCSCLSCDKISGGGSNDDKAINLSKEGTANCYIVSEEGQYKFMTCIGNGAERIQDVDTAAVLWESYGTNEPINVGDLLQIDTVASGYVYFTATSKKGNAVVAVMDKDKNILWSWHIWMTDKPEDQRYSRDAGIMMDRNLGATLTEPGTVESLGLLYQWGRKDPFPNGAMIKGDDQPMCLNTGTIVYEQHPSSNTIEYSIANPMVMMGPSSGTVDWLAPVSGSSDMTRWQKDKTIYDPCPVGYKVPEISLWETAMGTTKTTLTFDFDLRVFDFGRESALPFGFDDHIWYPMNGNGITDKCSVGYYCYLWSYESVGDDARIFYTNYREDVTTEYKWHKYLRYGVRCCRE